MTLLQNHTSHQGCFYCAEQQTPSPQTFFRYVNKARDSQYGTGLPSMGRVMVVRVDSRYGIISRSRVWSYCQRSLFVALASSSSLG